MGYDDPWARRSAIRVLGRAAKVSSVVSGWAPSFGKPGHHTLLAPMFARGCWGRVGRRRWLTSPGALSYAVVTRKIHRIGCGACWRKLVSQLRGRKQHTCTEAPRTRPSTSSFAFYDGHFTGCGWVSGPPAMLMARSTLVALPLFSFLLCSFF